MLAIIEPLAKRIGRGASGIAMLSLPTVKLAVEKVETLSAHVRKLGMESRVSVQLLLGRQKLFSEAGFYCGDHKKMSERVKQGLEACDSCKLKKVCVKEEGRFLHDWFKADIEIPRGAESSATLLVGTHAIAPAFLSQAPRTAPIVIDDDNGMGIQGKLGVVREIKIEQGEIVAAVDQLEPFVARHGGITAGIKRLGKWAAALPDQLAEIARQIVELKEQLSADPQTPRGPVIVSFVVQRKLASRAQVSKVRKDLEEGSVEQALARVQTLAEKNLIAAERDVAALIYGVLRGEGTFDERLRRIAAGLGVPMAEAIRQHRLGSDWSFERSRIVDEERRSVSERVLDILAEVIEHDASLCIDTGREGIRAYLPNFSVLQGMREGRFLILAVHRPPSLVAEHGNLEVVELEYRPRNVRVLSLGLKRQVVRGTNAVVQLRLGAGKKTRRPKGKAGGPGGASYADAVFSNITLRLAGRHARGEPLAGAKYPPGLAIIAHERDIKALKRRGIVKLAKEANAIIELGYHGRDASATDRFKGCHVAVIRGHALPPAEVARLARALRSALRLPRVERVKGDKRPVARLSRWGGENGGPEVAVYGSSDPLEAEIAHLHESAAVSNAIGRLRAPSRPEVPLLAVLCHGAPIPEIEVDGVLDEAGFKEAFGFNPLPGPTELHAVHASARLIESAERQERKAKFFAMHKDGRVRDLESAAEAVGATRREAAHWSKEWRLSANAGQPGFPIFDGHPRSDLSSSLAHEVMAIIGASYDPTGMESIYTGGVLTGPRLAEIMDELRRVSFELPERTAKRALAAVRSILAGEKVALPSRADAEANIRAVAHAWGAWLDSRAGVHHQAAWPSDGVERAPGPDSAAGPSAPDR
ncbi:MAG: hypothetical protein IPN34_14855 [Planctomycetes bacterium]|nr:hypothetical protein [Planctomycetota bacterium]